MRGPYTGHLLEEETFCPCLVTDDWYKPYRQAMAEVRANQPWDPKDPGTRFANDLHAEVAIALGLNDWDELRLYTAVGSALDHFHGVDAFFQLGGSVVTLDVTLNPAKNDYKADIIVSFVAVEDEYSRKELARTIADALRINVRQHAFATCQPR